jgi:O-antigen/teichoic acid export membrane protein
MGLASTLVCLGLPDALTRFAAAARDRAELQERFYSIFFMMLASGIAVSLLIFWASGSLAASLFGGNQAVTMLIPLIILIHSLNILLSYYFRTVQQMKRYSFFSALTIVLDLAFTSLLVLTGRGIYGAVLGILASRAVIFSSMLFLIISSIGVKIPQFKDCRAYLVFGLPLVPSILSSWVINSSNRYVITFLLGTSAVGLFSPGYLLGNLIVMFSSPLGLVLPVVLAKYYDENKPKEVEIMLSRSLRYYLALAIPATVGLSILSKPILSILSTQQIASQGYMITPLIAASMLIYGLANILTNIMVLKRNTVSICLIWIASAVVNLGTTVVLVRYMGIIGAAIATLASFTMIFLSIAFYSSRYLRVRVDYLFLAKSTLASIAMFPVILAWPPSKVWEIFAVVGACAGIYFAILFLLGGIEGKEIAFFKEVISKKS